MKSTLEIIREKVIEVVPEILELKFGCRVSITSEIDGERAEIVIDNSYEVNTAEKENLYQKETGNTERIYEIIGRPIQLADVLRVIDKIDTHCIRTDGDFLKFDEDYKRYISFGVWWDLSKPLEEQSEEVLEFLVQLLDNK